MKTIRKALRASLAAAASLTLAVAVAGAQMPDDAGMISIVCNLPRVETGLNLSREVYADIFLARVHRWGEGQAAAGPLGYLPLSEAVVRAALAELDGVSS